MRIVPLNAANQQEPSFGRAATIANVILGGGGIGSLLVLVYFVSHYSWIGDRQFGSAMGLVLYYLVPAGVAGLLFASLKLKDGYKINLAVLSMSLAASVLGLELVLEVSNASGPELAVWQVQGQSKEIKQRTREFARRYGVDFDTRDGVEVVGELRKGGVDAVPMVSKWLDPNNDLWNWQPDGSIQSTINLEGVEAIPLGAVADRRTVLCNESGQWITYPSDEHGFSNPKGTWQSNPLEIAVLGDSFAQGYCVPSGKSFVALIRQRFGAALNLGIAGNGPLLELAALEEYLPSFKPKHVLWFYCEGNDLTGLQIEKKISILMRYLKGDFNQQLIGRQGDIDQALIASIDRQAAKRMNQPPPQQRSWTSRRVTDLVGLVTLGSLREKLGLIQGTTPQEQARRLQEAAELADFEGANMDLFGQILAEAKRRVHAWGGTLHFVYLPSATRYFGSAEVPVRMRARVLSTVCGLGIPVIDIDSTFQAHGDVRSFFPWRGYGHYNEEGHRIVAEEVIDAVEQTLNQRNALLELPSRTEPSATEFACFEPLRTSSRHDP